MSQEKITWGQLVAERAKYALFGALAWGVPSFLLCVFLNDSLSTDTETALVFGVVAGILCGLFGKRMFDFLVWLLPSCAVTTMHTLTVLSLALILFGLGFSQGMAQEHLPAGYRQTTDQRLSSLQDELNTLKRSVKGAASEGLVLFLFGAFCALWAQNTNRSAWLWFFLGLFFSVLAVIILLVKNSNDGQQGERIPHQRR